jgi:hypothetical protein
MAAKTPSVPSSLAAPPSNGPIIRPTIAALRTPPITAPFLPSWRRSEEQRQATDPGETTADPLQEGHRDEQAVCMRKSQGQA